MNAHLQFLRQRIEHENNLINQRLSALVGSQAFLVSAFAISLNAPPKFHHPNYESLHRLLTHALPIMGIATVAVMMISLLGAVLALHSLHQHSVKYATPDDPPIHSSLLIRWMGHTAVVCVPLIFFLLWSQLLHPSTN